MSSLTVPANISVTDDCEQLRTAFKGWGTNEKLIISILAHRNAAQRKLIRDTYAEIFNEDLLKELDRELTNDFEKLVQLWTLDPSERDAHLAKEATKRWTSSNLVLVEIACTRSPKQLVLVREAYHARFKKSLEEDVAHHTTGDHRKLLVPLVSSYRYGGEEVDLRLAKAESKILHEKISDKAYSDDEVIRILATRSKAQINATLNHYKDEYGDDILKQLEEGDEFVALLRATIKGLVYPQHYFVEVLRDAINRRGTEEHHLTRVTATSAEVDLKIIVELNFFEVLREVINRRGTEEHHLTRVMATRGEVNLKITDEHYFFEVLRETIKRKGTEEHHLTRVIATRAEVDLKIIADEYQKRDSIPLGRAIAKDTKGDYESMLLALIGEEED